MCSVFIRPHLSEHSAEVPSRATALGSDLRMGLWGRSVPFHFFSSPKTSWRPTGREGSCGEGAPAGLCPWLVQDDCWVSGKGTHTAGGWGFNDVCGNLPGIIVCNYFLAIKTPPTYRSLTRNVSTLRWWESDTLVETVVHVQDVDLLLG